MGSGGGLEVIGSHVDEPDGLPACVEELDAVGVLLGEELDDRALGACREAADLDVGPSARGLTS